MKRILFSMLLVSIGLTAFSQTDFIRTNAVGNSTANMATYNKQTVVDANLKARLTLFVPKGTTPTLNNAKDSVGAIFFKINPSSDTSFYVYHGSNNWVRYAKFSDIQYRTVKTITQRNDIPTDFRKLGTLVSVSDSSKLYILTGGITNSNWLELSTGGSGFKSNIVLNGGAGTRLGYWVNGETIPVSGLGLDAAFTVITQRAVAPTYTAPTASISGSPVDGNYERGTVLSLTFSSGFTQNNGGALTGTTYRKNGTPLGGNTDNITLSATTSYDVQKTYSQGACIANNLGVIDCTGRINSGTATSGSITYAMFDKFYYGRSANATPDNATILASAGGSNFLSSNHTGTYTISASGSNYPFFAFPSSQGTVTSILDVNGFNVTTSFNTGTMTLTNVQGAALTYRYYILNSSTASNYQITIN